MATPHDQTPLPANTLFGAASSFLLSLALILVLFFAVGQYSWSGETPDGLRGTYVWRRSDDAAPADAKAERQYTFRFIDRDHVEVSAPDELLRAFYRVDHGRVFIETARSRGPNRAWAFSIQGEALVSPDGAIYARLPVDSGPGDTPPEARRG